MSLHFAYTIAYASKLNPCERPLKSFVLLHFLENLENIGDGTPFKPVNPTILLSEVGEPINQTL